MSFQKDLKTLLHQQIHEITDVPTSKLWLKLRTSQLYLSHKFTVNSAGYNYRHSTYVEHPLQADGLVP